jgi:hypothetical protein
MTLLWEKDISVKSKKLKTEWLWKSKLKSGRNFQGHLANDDDD